MYILPIPPVTFGKRIRLRTMFAFEINEVITFMRC